MEMRRLTPKLFFMLDLENGSMTAAQNATGMAYTTIHKTKTGVRISVQTARALEDWSRKLPSARAARVCIGAIEAVGLAAPASLRKRAA